MGAVWLMATGVAFHSGAIVLGAVLGYSFVAVAALVSLTDICVPSLFYRMLFGK
jgi:hypothetical protein